MSGSALSENEISYRLHVMSGRFRVVNVWECMTELRRKAEASERRLDRPAWAGWAPKQRVP